MAIGACWCEGASGAGGCDVAVDRPAKKIRLWSAQSKDRDFRDDTWTSRELTIEGDRKSAHADVAKPASGFTAFFAEVELPTPHGDTYKLSTQAQVVPDLVNKNP